MIDAQDRRAARAAADPRVRHGRTSESTEDGVRLRTSQNADGPQAWHLDVPDGDYELQLGLVEVEHDMPGTRAFDVEANGCTLLRDLDLAAAKGATNPWNTPPACRFVAAG